MLQPDSKNTAYPNGEHLGDVLWRTLLLDRDNVRMPLGPTGWKPLFLTDLYRIESNASRVWRFHRCWASNHAFAICGTTFEDIVIQMQLDEEYSSTSEQATPHQGNLLRALGSALHDRRLATTNPGYLGLWPPYSRRADIIAILFGGQVPVILQERGNSYEFIGTCYVHGIIMQGEARAGIETWSIYSSKFRYSVIELASQRSRS